MVHDLLIEPMLSWRDAQRRLRAAALPGLLSRLADGELTDFARVRTHQLDPWCMFLTQLSAIALHRAQRSDPRLSEEHWRELLLALTDGAHEPWSLIVLDVSQPAFFQPPVPEGSVRAWNVTQWPDALDVLATAKSHDVKADSIATGNTEAWVYAIVTLQTMQGVYGAGKYGVSRMRGGYACRPRVGYAADQTLAARFRRDVEVLLTSWAPLIQKHGYRDTGVSLVWTVPWDGTSSLSAGDLTPHFIEVCRRIRLCPATSGLVCRYTTSRTRRCLAEVKDGDVGDPWIPVQRSGGALNVGKNGFRYQRLAQLLSEDEFEPAAAQTLRAGDGDPVFLFASAMARGEGGTEGLHARTVVVTGTARRKLGEPDGRALVGRRATERVARAATIRSKVLYPALKQLTPRQDPMPDDLDARIDEMFFDHLFQTLPMDEENARMAFDRRLVELARQELQHAISRSPGSDARRLKAISGAERAFRLGLAKHFPDTRTQPAASDEASDGASA